MPTRKPRGVARVAVQRLLDRADFARSNGVRFTLRGASAGESWICNCRGRLNHGDKGTCYQCGLRRPGMRHWLAQSVRWGPVAAAGHLDEARKYLDRARFCAVFHGSNAETDRALVSQVAKDYGVAVAALVAAPT